MTGRYKIADRIFEIDSLYDMVQKMCTDYAADEKAEFIISTSEEDIAFERQKSRNEDIKEGIPVREFSDEYLETLAVYRKMADILADCDTILFHGSVVAVDGSGYLFTAKSGTGKSTHTALWRKYFGERAVMINDDKPLIKITDSEVRVYGTPWNGKHGLSTNTSVPLKALCILERGTDNSVEPESKSRCMDMLIQQVHRPSVPVKLIRVLSLIDRLADGTKLYRMKCNTDISAAETACNAMKG